MDTFWCDIECVEVDVIWLLKVKTHLDKLEKIQSKIKRKKLRKISTDSLLKKMVLKTLHEKCPNSEFFLVRVFLYLD